MQERQHEARIAELKQLREPLLRQIVDDPAWLLGSFQRNTQRGKGKRTGGHPHQYLRRRIDGRYKTTYVRAARIPAVLAALGRKRQLDRLLLQVSEINLAILTLGGEL